MKHNTKVSKHSNLKWSYKNTKTFNPKLELQERIKYSPKERKTERERERVISFFCEDEWERERYKRSNSKCENVVVHK